VSRRLLAVALAVVLLAGCGGSSEPDFPTIGAARTYALTGFTPAGPLTAGKPTRVSFVIRQPDGQPLTHFKRGSGPHTGVHVIFVPTDLSSIVHRHPPTAADGTVSGEVTFPVPGRYRMVVDAYPAGGSLPNLQLFRFVTVAGKRRAPPLPASSKVVETGGYRFSMKGNPHLKAIQAAFLEIDVTDAQGRPVRFTPYYGALAHAIFFRRGTLDYFHTHVCAPNASGCASSLGGASVTGSTSAPGKLRVGVLLPASGVWRLFLQTKVDGRILTAPFTLRVR
jgi:hypothetical protein